MLEIISFEMGPVMTNVYLVADSESKQAVVIDPAWDGELVVEAALGRGWRIDDIWLTHAHFDHMAGVAGIIAELDPPPQVALHPADLPLWRLQGGAPFFGMHIDPGPEPGARLAHGQVLRLGSHAFEVRHAPGHTPGHVVFYSHAEKLVFCGDVIFSGSIGRTDLPGGDYHTLIASIHSQILSLADETRLLCGHGPETTVGEERAENPFLS
ncbi:MAG: MBL fold metallo-hydrolase [Anaerolineales bacterium]|nr:MBL fold metallo-hydrolase [Anaerolineales bacterium]